MDPRVCYGEWVGVWTVFKLYKLEMEGGRCLTEDVKSFKGVVEMMMMMTNCF